MYRSPVKAPVEAVVQRKNAGFPVQRLRVQFLPASTTNKHEAVVEMETHFPCHGRDWRFESARLR